MGSPIVFTPNPLQTSLKLFCKLLLLLLALNLIRIGRKYHKPIKLTFRLTNKLLKITSLCLSCMLLHSWTKKNPFSPFHTKEKKKKWNCQHHPFHIFSVCCMHLQTNNNNKIDTEKATLLRKHHQAVSIKKPLQAVMSDVKRREDAIFTMKKFSL